MGDKPIEIVYSKNLNIENIKAGMLITDNTKNPKLWYVDEELIEQMREYGEGEEGRDAIRGNKLTGKFLFFKYNKDNPEK